ncbi:MAG: hypothetical protein IIT49_00910, partial [Clostridia bacterium]|nr:hypothetical protein [Clostridia bacterium]
MNKLYKIISVCLCSAMVLPLSACGKEPVEETESKNDVSSVAVVSHVTVVDSNDIPVNESPLAKEEFIFGNVFFNKAVTTIELSDTNIDSFAPLLECPYLETLTLTGCKIRDYSMLNSLTQIKNLTLSDCGFDNLSNVSDLIQLRSLDLSYNNISDIIKLSSLKNLQSLMIT